MSASKCHVVFSCLYWQIELTQCCITPIKIIVCSIIFSYCDFFFTVNVLLFVGTNIRGFYNMYWPMGSWIQGFKHYMQQSIRKFYFVGFLFSWFKWTRKSAKIRTSRLIMISQYEPFVRIFAIGHMFYQSLPELSVLTLSPISVNAYMPRILAKSVY